MKYLVTGGAGFIGSHLCEELTRMNHNVIAVDDLSTGFKSNLPDLQNIEFVFERIQALTDNYFIGLDGIFHLAAQASVPISIKDFYQSTINNLESSVKVFDMARRYGFPVVFASSSAIYGNLPLGDDNTKNINILSPYALDKLTIENYASLCYDLYGIGSIGLRFFNVYGPRQDPESPYSGVISIFLDRFINHQTVSINGGHQTRDFIFVKDIVNALVNSMSSLKQNIRCVNFNVGTGKSISIDNLFEKLCEIFEYKPEIQYNPLDKSDPVRSDGVFTKLVEELKITTSDFVSIDQGLIETVKYYTKS
jgi:UDP-glucose 4-epimerase